MITISLILKGDGLDPSNITLAHGISPDFFHKKVDATNSGAEKRTGVWGIEISSEWEKLSDDIVSLIDNVSVILNDNKEFGIDSKVIDIFCDGVEYSKEFSQDKTSIFFS